MPWRSSEAHQICTTCSSQHGKVASLQIHCTECNSPAGERRCGVAKPVLRSELFFQRAFYYYLMASNLLLRLAWTYKLSPHLRRNHDTVLAFTLLEVCAAN